MLNETLSLTLCVYVTRLMLCIMTTYLDEVLTARFLRMFVCQSVSQSVSQSISHSPPVLSQIICLFHVRTVRYTCAEPILVTRGHPCFQNKPLNPSDGSLLCRLLLHSL